MKILLKDWYLVSTLGKESLLSKNIWGVVASNSTRKNSQADYVFSSRIRLNNVEECIFVTKNGTLYHCAGKGKKISIDIDQFLWLRAGHSPEDLF